MAKFKEKIKATKLRKRGMSINQIAKKVDVSRSTVSYWVRDVILTIEQLERLRNASLKGAERGRIKGALVQKQKRLKIIKKYNNQGLKQLQNLNMDAFFAAGLALYWAEGSKMNREVRFCNSDPRLINFMIKWFQICFKTKPFDFSLYIGINEIHRDREQVVKKYWSKQTGIPLTQFQRMSYKKVKNKKIYANRNKHFGTLDVRLLRPGERYYKIMGQINGLAEAGRRLAFQDVS